MTAQLSSLPPFPTRSSRPLLKLLALAREIAVDAAAQPDPDRSLRTLRNGLIRLGFKRAGICVIDPDDPGKLVGRWGTDFRGNEIDEHTMVLPLARYVAQGWIIPSEKIATCRLAQPASLSLPHDSQLPLV